MKNNSDTTNNSSTSKSKEGSDSNKIRKDRKGRRRKMKCGKLATIKEYKNSQEIIVVFKDCLGSDGKAIEKKSTYANFVKGKISPEPIVEGSLRPGKKIKNYKGDYVGKEVETHKGHATIIEYRNGRDIDLELDDGTIIEHVRCHDVIKQSNRIKKRREQSET